MLQLQIALEDESYDEDRKEFIESAVFTLRLEHSLVSLSKWESHFEKPFLNGKEKTEEETLWYIQAMAIDDQIPPEVFSRLSQANVDAIDAYISAKMTATWFADSKEKPNREVITAEIVYYWMISLNIPFECEHWHFNRLLTLIKVCNAKNAPEKNLTKQELAARNRKLNEERKRKYKTSG